jgi:hypothetical protein
LAYLELENYTGSLTNLQELKDFLEGYNRKENTFPRSQAPAWECI